MFEVPADGLNDAHFETRLRIPSQVGLDFRRIDAVALVVSEAVFHEGDEVVVSDMNAYKDKNKLKIED